MTSKALVLGCAATMSLVWAVHAQTTKPSTPAAPSQPRQAQATPAQPAPRPVRAATPIAQAPAVPAIGVDEQKAFLTQYCAGCHSEKMKAAGLDSARRMTIDALDP